MHYNVGSMSSPCMMDAPPPLVDGDGRFPPKLQAHPNWVYETGRVATPWVSNLEPEGLRPATQAADPLGNG